jgi:hypothetical protein
MMACHEKRNHWTEGIGRRYDKTNSGSAGGPPNMFLHQLPSGKQWRFNGD